MASSMERLKEKYSWEGDKIKGSRFIVSLSPVFSEEEAKFFLEEIQELYFDARHHCYAYRLSNEVFRSSDCGEPRGTAGSPILQRIEGENLVDTMVIVTRYFGGTKLGVGGLIRAYGGAAGEALKIGQKIQIVQGDLFLLHFSYADSSIVSSVLKKCDGEVREEEYGEKITQTIFIPRTASVLFEKEVIEKSSNRIVIQRKV